MDFIRGSTFTETPKVFYEEVKISFSQDIVNEMTRYVINLMSLEHDITRFKIIRFVVRPKRNYTWLGKFATLFGLPSCLNCNKPWPYSADVEIEIKSSSGRISDELLVVKPHEEERKILKNILFICIKCRRVGSSAVQELYT